MLIPVTSPSCLVTKSGPTLCNPMDCSLPGSSIQEISQARILEWVAISFFRGSFQPRDQACICCIGSGFFTAEPPRKSCYSTINQKIVHKLTWESPLSLSLKRLCWNFPGSPVVKNLLCNAGDMGLIPGQRTKTVARKSQF